MDHKCKICGVSYLKKYMLEQHTRIHSSKLLFQCSYCENGFSSNQELNRHLKTHLQNAHICTICNRTFSTKSNLNTHIKLHSDSRPFKCLFCPKSSKCKQILEQHITIHTGEKWFSCKICGQPFSTPSVLNVHTRIHDEVRQYKCNFCEMGFNRSTHLNHHIQQHHPETLETFQFVKFTCVFCERSFLTNQKLMRHIKCHIHEKPEQCEFCGKEFNEASTKRRHITHLHQPKEKQHRCKFCPVRFYTWFELKCHQRTHTKEKPYKCNFCSKRYSKNTSLQDHITASHTLEKSFKCDQCCKVFAYRSLLKIHKMNTHNAVSHQCKICLRQLKTKIILQNHVRYVHQKIRTHSCLFCHDKVKFSTYGELKKHISCHIKERYLFLKDDCKMFPELPKLMNQNERNSGEGEKGENQDDIGKLNENLLNHLGENRNATTDCGISFLNQFDLELMKEKQVGSQVEVCKKEVEQRSLQLFSFDKLVKLNSSLLSIK